MLLEGIVFQTALTLIGPPQSNPTVSTHSSYDMNQLMKKAMFLLHRRIRTLVNFHSRRIICLRKNPSIAKLCYSITFGMYIFLLDE